MANPDFNWIVPLRRVVVKKKTLYRDLMWEWLRLFGPHKISRDDHPTSYDDAEEIEMTSYVLDAWYTDPKEALPLSHLTYAVGVSSLHRWWKQSFREAKITSSPVGETTCEVHIANFHARLWKGPKRVLLEQAAGDDEARLAELRPFTLDGGRIRLQTDESCKPKPIDLYPGDVLELPLHEFLSACKQTRFDDIQFDPKGSFYLGTTVKSKSGVARAKLPPLHDNLLAMRYQLAHALNMANCYHDAAVYTEQNKIRGERHAPEGAGVYARGMPFGGNPSTNIKTDMPEYGKVWEVSQLNTNLPEAERPLCMPTFGDLSRYSPGLPLTWGWVCSPFATFFFNYMANAVETQSGIPLGSLFRPGLAQAVLLGGKPKDNSDRLTDIKTKIPYAGDPLLLNNLSKSDVELPRTQTPLGDLCCYVLPEGREVGPYSPFTNPTSDRVTRFPLPVYGANEVHTWDEVCPGAGLIAVTSTDGHEFSLVKLYPSTRILDEAFLNLRIGKKKLVMPMAGRMAAYNPLSGDDVCSGEDILKQGHFFVTESSARMPPASRNSCGTLKLTEVRVHKFGPTPRNKAVFGMIDIDAKQNKKKKNPKRKLELQVDDEGRGFRDKLVSAIIWIREGEEQSKDPRALTNIYGTRRESWSPIRLKFSADSANNKPLNNFDLFYGERAVPFPTILEIAGSFPSRDTVERQLRNHRDWIKRLGDPDGYEFLEGQIAAEPNGKERKRMEHDKALAHKSSDDQPDEADDEQPSENKKKKALRATFLKELPP